MEASLKLYHKRKLIRSAKGSPMSGRQGRNAGTPLRETQIFRNILHDSFHLGSHLTIDGDMQLGQTNLEDAYNI